MVYNFMQNKNLQNVEKGHTWYRWKLKSFIDFVKVKVAKLFEKNYPHDILWLKMCQNLSLENQNKNRQKIGKKINFQNAIFR